MTIFSVGTATGGMLYLPVSNHQGAVLLNLRNLHD